MKVDDKVGVGETLCVAVLGDFMLLANPRDSEADVRLKLQLGGSSVTGVRGEIDGK